MPTYEYACKECGQHLEVVQSFTDDALTDCPHCHGQLRKVFGSIGISFKGSGFYKTDSRSSKSATAPASSGDGSSTSTKTESSSKTESTKTDSSSTSGSSSKSSSDKSAAAAS